jgi:hypothetical protein
MLETFSKSCIMKMPPIPNRNSFKETDRVRLLSNKPLPILPPYGNLVGEVAFSFCFPILGRSGTAGRSPPNSSFLERLHLVSLPSHPIPREGCFPLAGLPVNTTTFCRMIRRKLWR